MWCLNNCWRIASRNPAPPLPSQKSPPPSLARVVGVFLPEMCLIPGWWDVLLWLFVVMRHRWGGASYLFIGVFFFREPEVFG